MNRVVVIRAAAGLAAYLRSTAARRARVVDRLRRPAQVRRLRPRHRRGDDRGRAARPACCRGRCPRRCWRSRSGTSARGAGVMVTASHNPPQDNGYKVYLGDGVADRAAGRRARSPPRSTPVGAARRRCPRGDGWTTPRRRASLDAYLDRPRPRSPCRAARATCGIVYTPLHGVGGDVRASRRSRRAGFAAPHVVAAAGASPTRTSRRSRSPTPRSRARWTSPWRWPRDVGADIVIANDPDADRCAVAVPDPDGGWRMLRGDEVGALLGDHLLRARRRRAATSRLLDRVLVAARPDRRARTGSPYAETLTGFKWIARVPGLALRLRGGARLLRRPGPRSATRTASRAAAARRRARRRAARPRAATLLDAARRHRRRARPARHRPALGARRRPRREIAAAMDRLRAAPPTALGGLRVERGRGPSRGRRRAAADRGLRYRLAGGARVVVRPSGTEPKLKCYLEVVVPVDARLAATGVDAARIGSRPSARRHPRPTSRPRPGSSPGARSARRLERAGRDTTPRPAIAQPATRRARGRPRRQAVAARRCGARSRSGPGSRIAARRVTTLLPSTRTVEPWDAGPAATWPTSSRRPSSLPGGPSRSCPPARRWLERSTRRPSARPVQPYWADLWPSAVALG